MMSDQVGFACVMSHEDDAKEIFRWRNDPTTLKMSFHGAVKSWDSFYAEFLGFYFACSELPPLFVTLNGVRIGFILLRPVGDPALEFRKCCDVSITLAPEYRGRGLGSRALKILQKWVVKQGYQSIYAEVKKSNIPSHKAFSAAGFQQIQDTTKVVADTGEEVLIAQYLYVMNEGVESHNKVLVIAEAGSNWREGTPEGDRKRAFSLIDAAAEAGSDIIKFQTYRANTLYVSNAGTSEYLKETGIEEDIVSLLAHHEMPYEMITELAEYCSHRSIEFMSTPFSEKDFRAVDPFVKRHKIASYEISDPHLIELAAKSGKPLIMSTGASTLEDIDWAVQHFKNCNGKDLTLMQCTAQYPAAASSMNLQAINHLRKRYGIPVGLSDHSLDPIVAPLCAVGVGARVIEKHFTLDRSFEGPDHAYAIEPSELMQLVSAIREAERMLGSGIKKIEETEIELYSYACRAVQATRDIQPGEILIEGDNISVLRPGKQSKGVHPRFLDRLEGCPVKRSISMGSGIMLEDVET